MNISEPSSQILRMQMPIRKEKKRMQMPIKKMNANTYKKFHLACARLEEKVFERRIRYQTNISGNKFGYILGESTKNNI